MRGRSVAEWCPSRAYLSFYKLMGFLILRSKHPENETGDHAELLAFAPQQNSFEAFSLGTLYYLFALIFLSIGVQALLHVPIAGMLLLLPLLAFATFFVLEVLMLAAAIPISAVRAIHNSRNYDTRRISHWVFVAIYSALSCLLIRSGSSLALVGYCWLAMVAVNGLCSLLVRLLSKPMTAVDLRFRGSALFEN